MNRCERNESRVCMGLYGVRYSLFIINPRPEVYGSRFVTHSFVHSVHRATESSVYFFAPVRV